jgi:hypothetical protein
MHKNFIKYSFFAAMVVTSLASISLHEAYQQEPLPQEIESSIDRPFDFAGEELPMGNQDVSDRLDQEL